MSDLLDEIGTLRRRARADRDAHWFPLLVFGLLVLAASLSYQLTAHTGGAHDFFTVEDGPHDRYWLAALPAGVLVTLWWHRRHRTRIGIEGPIGKAVVAAVLLVVAYYALSFLVPTSPVFGVLFWVEIRDLGALLVIAALLLALAVLERDPLLGAVAVAYTVAAGFSNFYDMGNVFPYPAGGTLVDRWMVFPALYVPAAVLLAGSAALAARTLARRAA